MQEDQSNRRVINWESQLFHAVEIKSPAQAERVLSRRRGAPDCRDEKGGTPLMKASEAGDASMVGLLLRHRADPNAADSDGDTALMKAAYGGYSEVVELLMSHGADVDIRNNENMTALEIAQEMEHENVVALLSGQPSASTIPIEEEISTDTDGDGPSTDDATGDSASGGMLLEPDPEPLIAQDYDTSGATASPGAVRVTASTSFLAPEQYAVADQISASLAPKVEILEANEERIEFDALDNKQVRNINEKVIRVLDKASFEVGDFVVDTVFKGSYIAYLKPRSQENKRWRKLRKHPEWVIDPKRLTELAGGCAVRRYCLAEGKDVASFTISHFIELYYVKDLKLMLTLAEEASANNYTVRQIKRAAEDLREHKDDHDPGKEIIRTLD